MYLDNGLVLLMLMIAFQLAKQQIVTKKRGKIVSVDTIYGHPEIIDDCYYRKIL